MAPHANADTAALTSINPKSPTTTPIATKGINPSALNPHDSTLFTPLDFTTFSNTIAYPPNHPASNPPCQSPPSHFSPSPSTLEPGPPIIDATRADVEAAVAAAGRAYEDWGRATAYEERREQMRAFLGGLEREREGFLKCMVSEGGKPTFIAAAEFDGTLTRSHDLASLTLTPETVQETPVVHCLVRYYPLKVAAAIVPWNSPFHLLLVKLVPALLAGCPVIAKPSPHAPYTVLKLVELASRFFPKGVVQAVSGAEAVGAWLTGAEGVAKISFTGSVEVGKRIFETAARGMKRLTLELGGNDAAIVCEDIDVSAVASKLAMNTFGNTGAMCVASKRLYVHASIYSEFRAALVKAVQRLKVGDPEKEAGVMMGPVQNKPQYEKVKSFLENTETTGQKVVLQGRPGDEKGFFVLPTIVDNPPENSKIVQEEPFGPIAPLLSWVDTSNVIARANATDTGLGASIWSRDVAKARYIADRLEVGTVWINQGIDLSAHVPFGGHKMSGIGSELGGLQAIKSYCNQQAVWINKEL